MKKQLSSSARTILFILLVSFLMISCKEEVEDGIHPGTISLLQEDGSWKRIYKRKTMQMSRNDTVMILTIKSTGLGKYSVLTKQQKGDMNAMLLDNLSMDVWKEINENRKNGKEMLVEQRVKVTAPPYQGGLSLITFRVYTYYSADSFYYTDITVCQM